MTRAAAFWRSFVLICTAARVHRCTVHATQSLPCVPLCQELTLSGVIVPSAAGVPCRQQTSEVL
jgi:hypothetical protein